jgi:hypothetical protein
VVQHLSRFQPSLPREWMMNGWQGPKLAKSGGKLAVYQTLGSRITLLNLPALESCGYQTFRQGRSGDLVVCSAHRARELPRNITSVEPFPRLGCISRKV